MRNPKALLFLGAWIFLISSAATPNAFGANSSLGAKLKAAYQVITEGRGDSQDRFKIFSALLSETDKDCAQSCDQTIEKLSQFNSQYKNTDLDSELEKSTQALPAPEKNFSFLEAKNRLQNLFGKNSGSLKMRIRSSLEGVKALINMERGNLANIISLNSDKRRESIQEINSDVTYLFHQAQSLYRLNRVFKNHDDRKTLTEEEAKEIVHAVSDLGIIYVKLAQTMSGVIDDIPAEVTNIFKGLKASGTDLSPTEAEALLRQQLGGRDPFEVFKELNLKKPLAEGSIGYLYSAKVQRDFAQWDDVIIKLQRPNLEQSIETSQRFHTIIMDLAKGAVSHLSLSPVMDIVADQIIGLESSVRGEMDYRQEMRNMQRFSRYFMLNKNIRVPKVYPQFSGSKVLVMEKLPGEALDDNLHKVIASFKNKSSDPASVEARSLAKTYSTLLQSLTYMFFVTGEVHADLRPENILTVLKQEEQGLSIEKSLGFVDYGRTIQTRGMVLAPTMAGFHLLTGNVDGFTRRFLEMGQNPDAARTQLHENLHELVQRTFTKYGVQKVNLKSLLLKKDHLNKIENIRNALLEIISVSFKDLGYHSDPRYIDMLRAMTPIGMTMLSMTSQLDGATVARISLQAFAKGLVIGAFDYLPTLAPRVLKSMNQSVKEKLNLFTPQRALRCEKIFN